MAAPLPIVLHDYKGTAPDGTTAADWCESWIVVQFAQKHSPCHSEASFIGEESAWRRQRNSRFLARPSRASE
jgi:hypothetical protein